ncbi:hypothetical protein H9P43_001561 [Blastocladiella emersonii ATCC 22665]|nr:hypothetical protein H9P43_001561 [Blastocladiella emersonii ATCC 22665]
MFTMQVALPTTSTTSATTPAAVPSPFPLPATYRAGSGADEHRLTLLEDGTYTVRTLARCIMAPCPQAGGDGVWTYSACDRALTLHQAVSPNWRVTQVWQLGAGSRDADMSVIRGSKLVAARGDRATSYPMPEALVDWNRETAFSSSSSDSSD